MSEYNSLVESILAIDRKLSEHIGSNDSSHRAATFERAGFILPNDYLKLKRIVADNGSPTINVIAGQSFEDAVSSLEKGLYTFFCSSNAVDGPDRNTYGIVHIIEKKDYYYALGVTNEGKSRSKWKGLNKTTDWTNSISEWQQPTLNDGITGMARYRTIETDSTKMLLIEFDVNFDNLKSSKKIFNVSRIDGMSVDHTEIILAKTNQGGITDCALSINYLGEVRIFQKAGSAPPDTINKCMARVTIVI